MIAPLEALAPLVALLPEIEADGATFGAMSAVEKAKDGSFVMPWFELNDLGDRFHSLGHAIAEGLSPSEWDAWHAAGGRSRFVGDVSLVSSASLTEVQCLVVEVVRGERFCEGSMQTALDVGLVGGAIRRAAALMAE